MRLMGDMLMRMDDERKLANHWQVNIWQMAKAGLLFFALVTGYSFLRASGYRTLEDRESNEDERLSISNVTDTFINSSLAPEIFSLSDDIDHMSDFSEFVLPERAADFNEVELQQEGNGIVVDSEEIQLFPITPLEMSDPMADTVNMYRAPLNIIGQFPAEINLGDLKGPTIFKIDGEQSSDQSGSSVSGAGDVNGDGYNDLLIMASYAPGGLKQGYGYVIYGKPDLEGILSLLTLNSSIGIGFKIYGEMTHDQQGAGAYSISGSVRKGDFNQDGYFDILIGAPDAHNGSNTGRGYLIFGRKQQLSSIALIDLNGTNGFKLLGETPDDNCGHAVSLGGDLNGDNHTDILIGAPNAGDKTYGRSYVLFNGSFAEISGAVNLSTLANSPDGFILQGEDGNSGYSVSWLEDVNKDGYDDLIIGARDYNSNTGRSYVVFGDSQVGRNGVFYLRSVDGQTGFFLDGEYEQDYSGDSLASAGDVNGDGIADFMIGAYGYNNSMGRTYVIFGNSQITPSEENNLPLRNLNGTNGFKIDGEKAGDQKDGSRISSVGDFNNDGIDDLIIGASHYGNSGRCYLVFGSRQFQNPFPLVNLNGTIGIKLNGEASGRIGSSVSGIGDVNGDQIVDLLIGDDEWSTKGRSYVLFGDAPPVLVNNFLTINQNQTVILNNNTLLVTDSNHRSDEITLFIGDDLQYGEFQIRDDAGTWHKVNQFSQQNVTEGRVSFHHNGS